MWLALSKYLLVIEKQFHSDNNICLQKTQHWGGIKEGGCLCCLCPPFLLGTRKFTVITPDPLVCLDTRSRTCDCTYVQLLENKIGIIHVLFYSSPFPFFL